MKKSISIALCLIMLLSAASCSSGNDAKETSGTQTSQENMDNSAESDSETEAESEVPVPPVEKLDGAELTILNYTPESFAWANTLIFASDINGETLNDALYNREHKVEDLYDCTIEELASGDLLNTFKNSVTAQDAAFDVSMMFDANVADVLTGGTVMSWNKLSDLDLSNVWWDNAATEQYNFGGIQAAVSGAFSLYNYSTRHCYVFNEEMLNNVNPNYDIYTTVREGKWTVDELYSLGELAVSDLNGDGTMDIENDQWGITGVVVRHYSALFAGANCKYIDRNDENKVYFTVEGNENIVNVMTKLVNLNIGNYIYTSSQNNLGGGGDLPIFYGNRALFTAAYVGEAAKMRDIEFQIGIVPSPKLDETQESYHSLVEGGAQTILPKTLNENDFHNTAVILDALSYYSYIESIPAYIDLVLLTKVARDKDSSDMLELVFDTSFYDLGTGIWSTIKCAYAENVFLPKTDTIASVTQRNSKLFNRQLMNFEEKLAELNENN